jgi:SPP1 family predicted phage head-tail adaptor
MIINGKMTNPGELRTAVVLQKRTTVTTDAGGFQKPGSPTEYNVSAKWVNFHGSEVLAAQAAGIVEGATVTIRYRSDLDETWRISKAGQVYEIVSMDDIQNRHEYIELKVKKLKAA